MEESELMLIPEEDFMSLISSEIRVAHQFIKMIAHNVATSEENLLNMAYNSLRKKVAFGLIRLYKKYRNPDNNTVVMDMSRENMAYVIGVATESLIRTLSDFKSEKLIDMKNGNVVITDEKKLTDMRF